MVVRKQAQLQ